MPGILDLSARYIDEGAPLDTLPWVNRTTGELSEVADGIAVVEAFSHVVSFATDDGLVLFDTSLDAFAPKVISSLRGWSKAPVHTMAYTHGHIDHIGGAQAFLDEARDTGTMRPRVVGHAHVPARFDRYELTNGYNAIINERQFRASTPRQGKVASGMAATRFGPQHWVRPDTIFDERMSLSVGGERFDLRHDKGETDDHLWAWVPRHKAIVAGDFVIWVFPNAGNPQKVQRYPLEWARALRSMMALEPELLLPAHGLPVAGAKRIATLLGDMAFALEHLTAETLKMMNAGARLDDILHTVRVPQSLLDKPYMRPSYDEPEFVVRNVWRLYGGWDDGNPARLKPAPDAALAQEIASLAGGAAKLAQRAQDLSAANEMRLACHLAEMAVQAEPGNKTAHAIRRDVYMARREQELSLMAKGIYGAAARDSEAAAD
ncbi:MAG TPA: MBL fold metallo-hydrolase [Alphaproteobacteria bacterium]|nr:MBL fold metallo-hydrolase [Alphaproteobacteria bacterium]